MPTALAPNILVTILLTCERHLSVRSDAVVIDVRAVASDTPEEE
jgi:hypothetical protein